MLEGSLIWQKKKKTLLVGNYPLSVTFKPALPILFIFPSRPHSQPAYIQKRVFSILISFFNYQGCENERERRLKPFSHSHFICGQYAALKLWRGVCKELHYPMCISLSFHAGGDLGSKRRSVRVYLLCNYYRRTSKNPRHTTIKYHIEDTDQI